MSLRHQWCEILLPLSPYAPKNETPILPPAGPLVYPERLGPTQNRIRPAPQSRPRDSGRRRLRLAFEHPHKRRCGLLRGPQRTAHPLLSPGHPRRSEAGRLFQLPRGNACRRRRRHGVAAQAPQEGPSGGFPDRHRVQRRVQPPVLQALRARRPDAPRMPVPRSRRSGHAGLFGTNPLRVVHPGGGGRRAEFRNSRGGDKPARRFRAADVPAPRRRRQGALLVRTPRNGPEKPAGRMLSGRDRRADRKIPRGVSRQRFLPDGTQTGRLGVRLRLFRTVRQHHGRERPINCSSARNCAVRMSG